jgi:Zn-dependent peptidase ImmA (M78 family)/transcriptional regulator with XRE-family HTH domain
MTKVNPDILRWARETAGLSLEDACRKLNLNGSQGISAVNWLTALESGEIAPTRSMLIKMAKQYHRSLVVFYMSRPPQKGNRGQDFRTLPQGFSPESNALVDALIRDVQARQGIIRSGLEDEEEIEPLPFVKSMQIGDDIPVLLETIKKALKFDLVEFRKKMSPQDAFGYLRACVESIGIFVLLIGDLGSHHTDIGLEAFRGFVIADDIAPFIVINDQDSKAALSFTLIHELVHIGLGQTGVSNLNYEKSIEQFCNDVASEFLLPREELIRLNINDPLNLVELQNRISDFADRRNISNSMVAYKLFRMGSINKEIWTELNLSYQIFWNQNKNKQQIEARGKKGGPNYYTVHRYLLGANLMTTVRRMIIGGTLSTTKAGKILGIKAKNVQKLLESNGSSKVSRFS